MAKQSLLVPVTKNSTLASRPLTDLKENQIDPKLLINSFFRPGTYHHDWDGILETVNVRNYLELLRNFPGKLFFVNGSNCERDAEERFVGAAQEACLEILDGGNEWFVIDERFRERVLELVDEFLGTLDWNQKLSGLSFSFEDVQIQPESGDHVEKDFDVKAEPEKVEPAGSEEPEKIEPEAEIKEQDPVVNESEKQEPEEPEQPKQPEQ